jgi:hypothetical protein
MADFKTKVGGSYQFHEYFPAIAEQIAAERQGDDPQDRPDRRVYYAGEM